MPTIAILGASGVFGRHLTPRLAAAGYKVRALVRRNEAAGVARGCSVDVIIADIFDPGSLRTGLADADICINLATSLPGPSGRGDFQTNDRVRRDGIPILIEACRAAGVHRLLQQSIAMIGGAGDKLIDDDSSPIPEGDDLSARAYRAALDMESAIRASRLDWVILRGGLFYGPGTGLDDDWFARAAAGKLRLPGDGSDFVSLIHISDMATATHVALGSWPSRQTLAITDNLPSTWKDVLGYVAELSGTPAALPGGRLGFPSFRISNRRARETLNWSPHYSDFRSGLVR